METSSDESRAVLDEEAARLITAVDPVARGWSCAVLVRTNPRILSVINALRKAGLPATSEGRIFPCQDSDLAAVVLAFLRLLAHPSDVFSYQHLIMTPLGKFVGGDWDGLRISAMKRIREDGFHGIIVHLREKLELEDKPFAKARVEELLMAASQFDATWRGRATGAGARVRHGQGGRGAHRASLRIPPARHYRG